MPQSTTTHERPRATTYSTAAAADGTTAATTASDAATATATANTAAATAAAAAAARAADLLESFTLERAERYATLLDRLVGKWWSGRDRVALSPAAAALSSLAGNADATAAACEVAVRSWLDRVGFWRRVTLELQHEHASTVVARLMAAGVADLDAALDEVLTETKALQRDGIKTPARRPLPAAQLVLSEPDAAARRAWAQRVVVAFREMRRCYPWWNRPPAEAQRLLFWLVRDPACDPRERARAAVRVDVALRRHKLGDWENRFQAALLIATAARSAAEEMQLIERAVELQARLRRHEKRLRGRFWKRQDSTDYVDSAPLVTLLAIAHPDLDILVALVGALRHELALHDVHQGTPLVFLLLLTGIAAQRADLRPLVDGCIDLFIAQVAASETATAAAVSSGSA